MKKKPTFSVAVARINLAQMKQDCIDEIKELIKPYLKPFKWYVCGFKGKVADIVKPSKDDLIHDDGCSSSVAGFSERSIFYGFREHLFDQMKIEFLLEVLEYVRKAIDNKAFTPKRKKK